MHLWPSLRLRDSFNNAYLKKLEWNLHRMNTEKQRQQNESQNDCSSSNQQKLLDDANYSENSNKCGGLHRGRKQLKPLENNLSWNLHLYEEELDN